MGFSKHSLLVAVQGPLNLCYFLVKKEPLYANSKCKCEINLNKEIVASLFFLFFSFKKNKRKDKSHVF